MLVAETTRHVATATPPTAIELTPARLVPVIVTVPPAEALVAAIEVIVGAATVAEYVKFAVLVPVPPAVVTAILPVAVTGIAARMDVLLKTVNLAATPLTVTAVAPARSRASVVGDIPMAFRSVVTIPFPTTAADAAYADGRPPMIEVIRAIRTTETILRRTGSR